MSLYHEAAAILQDTAGQGGSLKSRIYTNPKLQSPSKQLFALVSETLRWSGVLKDIIEASALLTAERKVSADCSSLLNALSSTTLILSSVVVDSDFGPAPRPRSITFKGRHLFASVSPVEEHYSEAQSSSLGRAHSAACQERLPNPGGSQSGHRPK